MLSEEQRFLEGALGTSERLTHVPCSHITDFLEPCGDTRQRQIRLLEGRVWHLFQILQIV